MTAQARRDPGARARTSTETLVSVNAKGITRPRREHGYAIAYFDRMAERETRQARSVRRVGAREDELHAWVADVEHQIAEFRRVIEASR